MSNFLHHSPLRLPAILLGSLIVVSLCLLLALLAGWVSENVFTFERPPRVQEVALADLNGNGHLDAYLAIAPDGEPYAHPDYLLLNGGDGRFRDSGQEFAAMPSFSVKLGDVNGDGHADIVIGWYGIRVHLSSGHGLFDRGSYSAGGVSQGTHRMNVALADLDNDGSLDIFGAGCCGGVASYSATDRRVLLPSSQVWLNNGNGVFSGSHQRIGQVGSNAVALADLNGDGDLDAFLANGTTINADGNVYADTPNTVWFNDGQGNFQDSGQQLGAAESMAVALGDVNGNGFPDAVVGNRGADEIWLNDGQGNFSDSGQRLGRSLTRSIFLADLDGDGDLDLVVGGETSAQVWLNDGTGRFSTGQRIRYGRYEAITLGDVTGDGSVDIFMGGVASYQVWRGQGNGRFMAGPRSDFR